MIKMISRGFFLKDIWAQNIVSGLMEMKLSRKNNLKEDRLDSDLGSEMEGLQINHFW